MRSLLSVHCAFVRLSVLLVLDWNHVLELSIHLWNLSFLLDHIIMSCSLYGVVFRWVYLTVFAHRIASLTSLGTILVVNLNVVTILFLLEVLFEILLTDFILCFRASVCHVGSSSYIWSSCAWGAFETTFARRFMDCTSSSIARVAKIISFLFWHFWVLTRILMFNLSGVSLRRTCLRHDLQLHFATLYNILCL